MPGRIHVHARTSEGGLLFSTGPLMAPDLPRKPPGFCNGANRLPCMFWLDGCSFLHLSTAIQQPFHERPTCARPYLRTCNCPAKSTCRLPSWRRHKTLTRSRQELTNGHVGSYRSDSSCTEELRRAMDGVMSRLLWISRVILGSVVGHGGWFPFTP